MATEAEWKMAEVQLCPKCMLPVGDCDWCSRCKIALICAQTLFDAQGNEGWEFAKFDKLDGVPVLILGAVFPDADGKTGEIVMPEFPGTMSRLKR